MAQYPLIDGEALLAQLQPLLVQLRGRIAANVDMGKVTWFRTGGLAEIFFQPADEDDLVYFLQQIPAEVPVTVVGIGSNLLIRDGGIKGVVIRLSAKGFGHVEQMDDRHLCAGAATPDKKLAMAALEASIAGFHFYHGIPGNLGGALKMNGGANGVETCERVVEVHALDRHGKRHVLDVNDMHYAYRHSQTPDGFIFVSALMQGEVGRREDIQKAMDEVAHHREMVQPIREKTGGSTFRNPEGISAWKVIDAAGCRGFMVGDAQMSEMHCNFMINRGAATAYDLELLGETVRQRVYEHSGHDLHWEIQRIGLFEADRIVKPFVVS